MCGTAPAIHWPNRKASIRVKFRMVLGGRANPDPEVSEYGAQVPRQRVYTGLLLAPSKLVSVRRTDGRRRWLARFANGVAMAVWPIPMVAAAGGNNPDGASLDPRGPAGKVAEGASRRPVKSPRPGS